ncbi:hypothetical protein EYF80_040019 [Liparis tanakae]|uniref:Uncharacterized protein n=1 Tax=Liparis tanakae TaxID=230148 RepID=A0A4Z2G9R5_9TELE|nr:hypothetical protein EYF80_040019 [Liparis tanakae]
MSTAGARNTCEGSLHEWLQVSPPMISLSGGHLFASLQSRRISNLPFVPTRDCQRVCIKHWRAFSSRMQEVSAAHVVMTVIT